MIEEEVLWLRALLQMRGLGGMTEEERCVGGKEAMYLCEESKFVSYAAILMETLIPSHHLHLY